LLVLSALIILVASCSKKIDEAYKNPNYDVKVAPETLMPQIVASMAGNYGGHGPMNDIRYIGAYVQNFAFSGTQSNFDRMGHTNADVAQSFWRSHYYDIGQNNVKLIEWALENKQWELAGVGKAIFAWSWLTLTDYHGEVILKDAFNTDLITFKYDTQEEVYMHARKLSFEALDLLNKTGENGSQAALATGDAFLYGGNVSKWKKFVYGVLARTHHHLTNKSIYKADSVLYYTNLAMKETTDDALVKFAATSVSATNNFLGPFRNNLGGATVTSPTAIRQSAFIADLMSGLNPAFSGVVDPRAIYLLRRNTNGTFKGVEPVKGQLVLAGADRPENFHGVSQATGTNNTAPATDVNCRFIFRNSAPFPVMTATEMAFIRAEAAFIKGDKATALSAYRDGISKHFDLLMANYNTNVPTADLLTAAQRDAFLANTAVVPASANSLTLPMIMLQKYIALWGHGTHETWVDMRRYHYTDKDANGVQVYTGFTLPAAADIFQDNGGKMAYRMRPRFNSEYVWNINELNRIGATAIDYHTKEMWFSTK
ncbi:MAG: SusD/RagB family nutrient-binding outer membrane lipoprotein, partial [Sphingomonadales bacterium]